MDTVLVTGAYGFLGQYVVKELTDHGCVVRAFGRDRQKLDALTGSGVTPFEGDLRKRDDVIRAAEGMRYVIHCGALMGGWGCRDNFMRTNVDGTENVLEACRKAGTERLVYVSSPSTYATQNNLCITEDDYNSENRLNYYIESKILAEQLVRGQSVVPFAMIRPRGLCGIGDRNMLPVLIRANQTVGIPLFQKGEVIVDLCCVENAATALRLCMKTTGAVGRVYNITNGEPRRLTDLAEEMFAALGTKPKYFRLPFGAAYSVAGLLEGIYRFLGIHGSAPALTRYNVCTLGKSQVFDITRARNELGYSPEVSLSDMIQRYAKAYLAGRA